MPETTVRDLMRPDVPVASRSDSIATVARLLVDSGLPGIPVLDEGGEIVGIVTEKDLIARQANVEVPTPLSYFDAIFELDGGRDFDEELRHVLAVTAGDLMTSPVFNVLDSATLSQVATLMVDEGVNPIPVLDQESRQLVGIVSRADLVRVIALMEAESATDATTEPAAPSS